MGAIRDLYYGRIDPVMEPNINSEEYSKLDARTKELCELLNEQLSEKAVNALDELIDIQHQMESLTAEDFYIKGFRNGAAIIRDVLEG